MAVTVVSTLYPPMLETFQPAFECNTSANVTFPLSPFNSIDDINYIHITVSDNDNNENALSWTFVEWQSQTPDDDDEASMTNLHSWGITNGILISSLPKFTHTSGRVTKGWFTYDADRDLYMVSIPPKVLEANKGDRANNPYWDINRYYKIQIRFDSTEPSGGTTQPSSAPTNWGAEEGYMIAQRSNFSEWSTVTLVKPIAPLDVYFTQIDRDDNGTDTSQQPYDIVKGYFRLVGSIGFDYDDYSTVPEEEHLKNYRVRVYPSGSETYNDLTLIFDSGLVYAVPNYTDFRYGINTLLDLNNADVDTIYDVVVDLCTNNDYTERVIRQLHIQRFNSEYFTHNGVYKWNNTKHGENGEIFINQEDGCAIINFIYNQQNETNKLPKGTFYFFRSTSKNNWKTRDIIYTQQHAGGDINEIAISFEDYTICSLHQYKYFVQYEIEETKDWTQVWSSNSIYPKFYDMLLMRQNRQIAIRYNGQITSWKPTVNRQKIDTLGGRYPKFVENATMNYKTYQIQGLISAEGDYNRKFLNEFDGETIDSEYQYYYNEDMARYNKEFGGTYQIRNDTYPDGELGYNPKDRGGLNEYTADSYKKDYGNAAYPNLEDSLQFADSDKYKLTSNYNEQYWDPDIDDYSEENPIPLPAHQIHDVYPHDNWYWERIFREELVNWLNDGEPKLYRSMPEGNVAVMLTDIQLTPNAQLGRRLYNFSATLYEIGEGYDLDSLDALGIITIPKQNAVYLSTDDSVIDDSGDPNNVAQWKVGIGQLKKVVGYAGGVINQSNITNPESIEQDWDALTLAQRITQQKYTGQGSNYAIAATDDGMTLNNVRLQFSSEPHYYYYHYDSATKTSNWYKVTEGEDGKVILTPSTTYAEARRKKNTYSLPNVDVNQLTDDSLWLGYVIQVTEQGGFKHSVFINEKGFYQFPEQTVVSEIEFDAADEAYLDYQYKYVEGTSQSGSPTTQKLEKTVVGQLSGTFYNTDDITNLINEKYYFYDTKNKTTTYIQYWRGLDLDITPYAVLNIKYNNQSGTDTLYVGRTGVLNLFNDYPIASLNIIGRRMFKLDSQDTHSYPDEWEYREDDTEYNSVDEVIKPQPNTVYTSLGKIYYLNGHWYDFNSTTEIALVPIEGMINYIADVATKKVSS